MAYLQTHAHSNESYLHEWVKTRIEKYGNSLSSKTALDVGAGLSPYKPNFEALGFNYFSQDFGSYRPSEKKNPGLQNRE